MDKCPRCGYCEKCGRSDYPMPYYPAPIYPTGPWWTTPVYTGEVTYNPQWLSESAHTTEKS